MAWGGGRIALDKLGITPKKYFASEIKSHAIKCATTNYPDIIEIGDVTKVKYEDNKLYNDKGEVVYEGHIDLLIGGSPCQDFSIAN
jgi:site-specific DNA-cytosine methylase